MDSSDWQDIVLTHVVNPYGIWAANLSEFSTVDSSNILLEIHNFLEKEYMKKKDSLTGVKYQIGQVIGIYYSSMKIWARGIIDDMYSESSMLVWLTDFGYHLSKITLPELIMPLGSEACSMAPIMIHKLGLYGILPAQFIPDTMFSSFDIKPCKFWLPAALKVMEDYLRKCSGLKFQRKCDLTHSDGMIQHFGKFLLVLDGHEVDFGQLLIRHKIAIDNEELFNESFSSLKNVLRIDRLVPHTERHINIGNRLLLNYNNISEPNHLEYLVDWTKNAAKATKKNLMAPVEDVVL